MGRAVVTGNLEKGLVLGSVMASGQALVRDPSTRHSQTGEDCAGEHLTRERVLLLGTAESSVSVCTWTQGWGHMGEFGCLGETCLGSMKWDCR